MSYTPTSQHSHVLYMHAPLYHLLTTPTIVPSFFNNDHMRAVLWSDPVIKCCTPSTFFLFILVCNTCKPSTILLWQQTLSRRLQIAHVWSLSCHLTLARPFHSHLLSCSTLLSYYYYLSNVHFCHRSNLRLK